MIGERLSELRKDRGISQEELGERLSLTKFTISSYEREKTMPSDDIKIEIAKIFNVSLYYLLGLIDTPVSYNRDAGYISVPECLPKEAVEIIKLYIDTLTKHYSEQK